MSLPDPIEVDERQQQPNGTILTVETVSFEDDYISVEFNVQNGYDSKIQLAELMNDVNKPGVILGDDTGFDYRYLPGDNQYLSVESGERMSGSINFVRSLEEDATSLTLEFNPKFTLQIDID